MHKFLTFFFISIIPCSFAQKMDTIYLEKLLQGHPELFQKILDHPSKNEVQILYTQIDRDKNNVPHFKSFSLDLTDYLQSFGCSETSCFFYLTLTGEDIFAENFFYPSSFTDIKNLEPAE